MYLKLFFFREVNLIMEKKFESIVADENGNKKRKVVSMRSKFPFLNMAA